MKTHGVSVIGCRVGDPHRREIPGSTVTPCCKCGTDTMFSPETRVAATRHPGPINFVCVECSNLDNHWIAPRTPEQKAEIAAALPDMIGKVVKRRKSE